MKGRALGSCGQVTLVIMTFDRPAYLQECLASVARQTLAGFRLVVLDNASTADLSGVLARFPELPMSYVRNETNLGAGGNFQKAMRVYKKAGKKCLKCDTIVKRMVLGQRSVFYCPQ